MSIEDQPTQQIRRPQTPAPMPGPLDPTYRPGAPQTDAAAEGSTEVLSLDELLDRPATAPAAPRIGPVPVRSEQDNLAPGGGGRLSSDAAAAWHGGLRRSRAWLAAGDNTVIVATVLIAVFLLLAVALF